MSEGTRRPSELLGGDHASIDARWERIWAAPGTNGASRRGLFDVFRTDLERHIQVEEELLFPWMASSDPSQRTLVTRLQEEHQRIRELLARTAQELTDDSPTVQETAFALVNELWAHNAREEGEAYPWLDRHLSPDRWNVVAQRLER